jgi:hypothetical protein
MKRTHRRPPSSATSAPSGRHPAILHHHEHFDGSSCPDSLASDRIPIASHPARLDAFDAMTATATGRRCPSRQHEAPCCSGSQFGPVVVDNFPQGAGPPAPGCAGRQPPRRGWPQRRSVRALRRPRDPKQVIVVWLLKKPVSP